MKPWGLILAFVFMRPLYQNRERIQAQKNKKNGLTFWHAAGCTSRAKKLCQEKNNPRPEGRGLGGCVAYAISNARAESFFITLALPNLVGSIAIRCN